ncbi:PTS sugar transporter subunit IIA [Bacillus sp. FJAT-50079]|uniref:PTS sugar transporter subunit IIA n=1 Tax=Bacillus sp. FJAT-50079 TaxID=2833577 RepID=UPI001BCA62F0|nr:PTS sugar transporter subunit IIA [Bacillus sp. FJAT-50079]MBS4210188.1 PTS sugar transporter subunit IIA [Bacillus sp. FJAT-50079]
MIREEIQGVDFKMSLIENNSILLNQEADTWQEAVKMVVDLLVKAGTVTEEYYDKIIKSTEELGAYYILCPKMAMPHARPGDYVLKDSFSFLTLKKPVLFPGEQEVDVLVCLAATNSDNHLEQALPQIATFFSQDQIFEKIYRSATAEDLLKLI